MHVLVLSRNAALYSTSRLVLAARSRGHEVTVADPLDFHIVISKGRPSMFLGGRPIPHAALVVPRIGASITNYGLAVVRHVVEAHQGEVRIDSDDVNGTRVVMTFPAAARRDGYMRGDATARAAT